MMMMMMMSKREGSGSFRPSVSSIPSAQDCEICSWVGDDSIQGHLSIEVLVLAISRRGRKSSMNFWRIVHGIGFSIVLHVLMLRFKLCVVDTDTSGPVREHCLWHSFHCVVHSDGGLFPNLGWSLPTSLGQSGGLVYFASFSCLQYYCLRGFNTRNRQDVFVFGFLCFSFSFRVLR